MPNYVFNIVRIEGGFKGKDLFTNGNFDFNKIVPMPPELDITCGSDNNIGLYMLLSEARENVRKGIDPTKNVVKMQQIKEASPFGGIEHFKERAESISDPEEIKKLHDLGEQTLSNYINYGCGTWYDWCCKHWSTKWNAMDTHVTDDEITFSTAWSPPVEVIRALSMICQGCKVECEYHGEIDCPGKFTCLNGEIIEDIYFEYDDDEDEDEE